MSKKLNIGIIGCGKIAAFHVNAINQLSDKATLAGVFDKTLSRAEEFAAANGGTAYDDLDKMAKAGLDAVIVCTPPMVHHLGALPFLEAGIPAFIEKPFASTLEQADMMLAASKKSGAPIGVCCQRRWLPPMQRIYTAIAEGRLGKLITCSATINGYRTNEYYEMDGGWRGKLATEGGALLPNQAPHHTDLMISLMGPIHSVSATVANLTHPTIDGDDNVFGVVRFKSGALGSVRYSNSQKPGFYAGIEVTDENGITVVVKTDGVMFVAGAGGATGSGNMVEPPSITHWSEEENLKELNAKDAQLFNGFADSTMQFHIFALADFIEAIQAGRAPRIDGMQGRETVQFNTACYLSSAQGGAPIVCPLKPQPDSPDFEGRKNIYKLPA
jgi:UDP-N-acetyl-2-amino-2-deoxyglucuronate dehydrogenase